MENLICDIKVFYEKYMHTMCAYVFHMSYGRNKIPLDPYLYCIFVFLDPRNKSKKYTRQFRDTLQYARAALTY